MKMELGLKSSVFTSYFLHLEMLNQFFDLMSPLTSPALGVSVRGVVSGVFDTPLPQLSPCQEAGSYDLMIVGDRSKSAILDIDADAILVMTSKCRRYWRENSSLVMAMLCTVVKLG